VLSNSRAIVNRFNGFLAVVSADLEKTEMRPKSRRSCSSILFALTAALLCLFGAAPVHGVTSPIDYRGAQFFGFTEFSTFAQSAGQNSNELVLTSTQLVARIPWTQLVASWNADMPKDTGLKIEARALYPEGPSKYYVMGLWSADPAHYPRQSVNHQKDADGEVSTDTLTLQRPCEKFDVRLTLSGDGADHRPKVKFLSLSLCDAAVTPPVLPPNPAAWGKTIPVPERSQMGYPNGKVLCSPTTVSMIMTYWSRRLKRPEIDHDVPEIVNAIYDSGLRGTGNWPFNMAYAGSYPGLRAYATRLSDVSELEDWIAAGLPVGMSLCYDRLRGKGPGPNGHLVVCVGFTTNGDVIVNDPGTTLNVRKTFPRKNLIYAWSISHNTVYLIYPEDADLPKDRFGHWTP
jgi:Peptidase_C39 like family